MIEIHLRTDKPPVLNTSDVTKEEAEEMVKELGFLKNGLEGWLEKNKEETNG